MDIVDIANNVVNMPNRFYNQGRVSYIDLIKNSGYVERSDEITEEIILKVLPKFPKAIVEWLKRSEDHRGDKGYYFVKHKNTYTVGYYDQIKNEVIQTFKDANKGCAFFIKKEAEKLREIVLNKNKIDNDSMESERNL